jgi:2-keto-3-deoxy-L-rhamnonate aldolase RhmA
MESVVTFSRADLGTGLRGAMAARRQLLTTFLMTPHIEFVEMLALAGFDGVLLDLEHGVIGLGDVSTLVATAHGRGIFCIARMAGVDPAETGRVLDCGVDGLVLPHVATAREAAGVVSAGRYPPIGERSLNPYVRGLDYGMAAGSATDAANDRIALIPMIEGRAGLDQLDPIATTPGIDGIFVGPVDLAASLGFPGLPEDPQVIAAVDGIFRRVSDLNVPLAAYAPTPAAASRWFSQGAALIALSTETALSADAFRAAVTAVDRTVFEATKAEHS